MSHRKEVFAIAAAVLFGVALLGAGGSTADGADQATLAGQAGPGPYPKGCVDCHSADGAENIAALLKAAGHKNIDKTTETVPGDCVECHSDDGGFTLLSELAHLVHYQEPAENAFVGDYGGNCLHCHALDASTGAMTVKSGPKNW